MSSRLIVEPEAQPILNSKSAPTVPATDTTELSGIESVGKPIMRATHGDATAHPTGPTADKKQPPKQLTDYFPVRRSIRKTKKAVEQENLRHIELAIEKQLEDGLMVKVFKDKGRGICAARPFSRGEFVVEYIGDLIDQTEADRREEIYAKDAKLGCYMYYFKHKEQQWW